MLSETRPNGHWATAPASTGTLMNSATPVRSRPLSRAKTGARVQNGPFARPTARQPRKPTGDSR